MLNNISLKDLRPKIHQVIKNIDTRLDRYILSKRGKPIAIMMNIDDYEGLIETLNILSDKNTVKRIKNAKNEIKDNKTISMKKLRKQIENV